MIIDGLELTIMLSGLPPLGCWDDIDIDHDLFTPADAGQFTGPTLQDGTPIAWPIMARTNRVSVSLAGLPIFTGTATHKEKTGSEQTISLQIHGVGKLLVDCATPRPAAPPAFHSYALPIDNPFTGTCYAMPLSRPTGTLAAWATELCGQLGVQVAPGGSAFVPRADAFSQCSTMTVWNILQPLVQEAGCWMWVDELGVAHVEELARYYATPPVDALICMPAGMGSGANNVLDYRLIDDAGDRFSHVIVRGNGARRAQHGNLIGPLDIATDGIAVDPEMCLRGIYRPLVIEEGTLRNVTQTTKSAMRQVALRRVRGTKIEVDVEGWRSATGAPWKTTQMVFCAIPADGINGVYFIAGRRFTRDGHRGTRTTLTLIEPGVL